MMKKIATLLCATVLLAAVPALAQTPPAAPAGPDFTVTDIDGKTFQLASFKDKKPVVVNIMQSSCSSCKDELKVINGLLSDKFEFIAINVDARGGAPGWNDNVKNYMKELEINVRMASDPKFSVGRVFGVYATPATILVSKEGKVVKQIVGFNPGTSEAELKTAIGELK